MCPAPQHVGDPEKAAHPQISSLQHLQVSVDTRSCCQLSFRMSRVHSRWGRSG